MSIYWSLDVFMWKSFHGCRLFFPVVHPVKLGFVEFFFSPFFFQLSIWWFRSVAEYLVLENPFLKISFLRISPTTGFPQWSMPEISTVNIMYTYKNKLSPEVFCPKKSSDKKTWPQPPKNKKTPVAPTVYPTPRSAIPAPISPRSAPRSSRVHLEELRFDVRVALADSWGYSVSTRDWR